MDKTRQLSGLYAITAGTAREQPLLEQVAQALEGGARIIQYRDKHADTAERVQTASALAQLCKHAGALFIVNDDVALARESGADGVHLGKDDPDIATARRTLGAEGIIGVSCYNQLKLAIKAQQAGADYVAFGRFFPSSSKPEAAQAEIELLQTAKTALRIPVVAIGGITPENGALLLQAGAQMLAVIDAIFGQDDIQAACAHFQSLFNPLETCSS